LGKAVGEILFLKLTVSNH